VGSASESKEHRGLAAPALWHVSALTGPAKRERVARHLHQRRSQRRNPTATGPQRTPFAAGPHLLQRGRRLCVRPAFVASRSVAQRQQLRAPGSAWLMRVNLLAVRSGSGRGPGGTPRPGP
jgi:hypothetical protein